jgi:hypothetical protein
LLQVNVFGGTVEANHLAVMIPEMMPMSLGEVIELVLSGVRAAGRDDMQKRFPQLGPAPVDEGDVR